MKSEAALAFASGYLLGRRRKVRWAVALAGMAAGKRLASGRLPVNTDALPTAEIGKVGRAVRGKLVSAGRSAAISAASNRMDALSDRMERRTSTLRPGGDGAEEPDSSEEREPSGKRESKAKDSKSSEPKAKDSKSSEPKAKARERKDTSAPRSGGRSRSGERNQGEDRRRKPAADRPAKTRKQGGSGGSGRRSQG
ncbi:hypothetical protein [Streptomyces sp. NPDC048636]|uniref:hypothetical protein n=1 Tax=Streptomyces sp. NPDC048636 TaxID=3155762 RepID=UPI00343C066B